MELHNLTLPGTLNQVNQLFDNYFSIQIRHFERSIVADIWTISIRFPEDQNLKNCILRAESLTDLIFLDLDRKIAAYLLATGFYGQALPKYHYDDQTTCLRAYQIFNLENHFIQARQFSTFFGYRLTRSCQVPSDPKRLFYSNTIDSVEN